MIQRNMKAFIEDILAAADIRINGSRPFDIRIRDERFYDRVIRHGSLGLGEAYMDGWWDCESLDDFFCRIMPTHAEKRIKGNLTYLTHLLRCLLVNSGHRSKAFLIGKKHYDIGNDLYGKMLDKRMVYSCGYWKGADNLDDAQEAKLELICRKLGLKGGERVLDIGCGWGGFAKYASEQYGAKVVGITVSGEQADLAEKLCAGLPIEIRLQDYRDLDEKFDHVVSVGMFEHVGYKNYRTFMETVRACLRDDGLFLLHTIGSDCTQKNSDPWFDKYIFPNSHIPSVKQIGSAIEGLFIAEDWHNFGFYYDPTLMAWFRNFESNWAELRESYDDRFYRMWKYYLVSSAGTFRSRCLQVWQVVLSKNGVPGGYNPIR